MIKILIIDDHTLIIEGLKRMLEEKDEFQIVGTASTSVQTKELLKTLDPDVIFMDINLTDCTGIDLCREILLKYPSISIIAISSFCTPSYIQAMLDSGAKGYLLKNTSQNEIITAIYSVLSNKIYLSQDAKLVIDSFKVTKGIILTRREREVLQLIANGKSNSEIAKLLFISPTTVDSHRTNLLAKFNTNNTALLLKQAIKQGFVLE